MTSFLKIFLFIAACVLQGLPFSAWSLLFLMVLGIGLYGLRELSIRKAALVGVAFLLLKGAVSFVPTPFIQERHNVFYPGQTEQVKSTLIPQAVQDLLNTSFDEAYPEEKRCSKETYGCWQFFTVPPQEFAFSADGFFQRCPSYSRCVTRFDHKSLAEARIGVANSTFYNYYDQVSDLKRRDLPYYIFYKIPPAYAGGALQLKGTFFLQKGDAWEKQVYDQSQRLEIPADGYALYGIKMEPEASLEMALHRPFNLILGDVIRVLLMGLLPLLLFLRVFGSPAWGDVKILTLSVGSFFLACILLRPDIFTTYPLLDGGGDGLVYEGYGREILQALFRGNIREALRGGESLYYFMPGLRYLKALEKILVGESFLGLACLTSFLGFFIHQTLRHFLSPRGAWWGFLFFCFIPLFERFGFAGYLYAQKIYSGHGEPLAILMFFVGSYGMMRGHDPTPIKGSCLGFPTPSRAVHTPPQGRFLLLSALAFSLSAFIRPSFLVPIGFFTGTYWVMDLIRTQNLKEKMLVTWPYLGYATLGIMPLHNFFFGGEWVLTTTAALHPVNLHVTFADYGHFFQGLAAFDLSNPAAQKVLSQLKDWNGLSDFYRFIPLAYVLVHAFRKRTPLAVRALSLSALSAHALLFFYIAVGRYAYLAWTLSLLVFFYEYDTKLSGRVAALWSALRKKRAS